ncbi:MAG: single-stranded DNA-binding protein, partial [Deltaproteobacteria bacterium]|nr:single-stranded DNA-binding protein [Deltaproteobacteria bacterium]
WARARFGTPERFFERFFVLNYCPLAFLEASGRNLTPDKLPAVERGPLLARCDEALRQTVTVLRPRVVVGVGAFARDAAKRALEGTAVAIGCMLHPSPASPRANRDWQGQAEADLTTSGIHLPR